MRTPYLGGLISDANGNLYGTTEYGGPNGGGTVFECTNSGGQFTFNTLYGLSGVFPEMGPPDTVFRDNSGNLYGVTTSEGAYAMGNIFELSPSGGNWIYADLHDFAGGLSDGAYPVGSPRVDSNGNIFGTATQGGMYGQGVAYEIVP